MSTAMFIFALALAAYVVNAQNEGCGLAVLDKCYRGFPTNGSTSDILVETVNDIPDAGECQWFCKEVYSEACTWFAFDSKTSQCNLFKGSIDEYTSSCEVEGYKKQPDTDACNVTFAGEDACYNFREGYCRFEDYVVLENLETVQSLTLCQQACRHRPNCEFFVYEKKDQICHLQGGVKRDCDIVHGLPEPSFAGCLTENKIPFKSSA